jgi:hypothetical protein
MKSLGLCVAQIENKEKNPKFCTKKMFGFKPWDINHISSHWQRHISSVECKWKRVMDLDGDCINILQYQLDFISSCTN